jgi:DNA modification methylase
MQHVYIAEPLRPLALPIDSLTLDPANVRRHPERNLEAIKGSLARFGQQKPIVVGADSVIVAGNGTVEAARALGWTHVAAVRTALAGADRTAFAIADNRTADLAEWDEAELAQLLESLPADLRLDAGFTDAELEELLGAGGGTDVADADDAPAPAPVAVSKPGDLGLLGGKKGHRLLCGDSTKLTDVQRVMDGKKAALVATDPPYLVEYTGERPNDSGKDWSGTYHEIDITDADGFFRALFTNVLAVLGEHAAVYTWHAHKRQALIARVWEDLGILDHQQIVWVKPTSVFGRVYWHFQHEPCMMGWRTGSMPEHDGVHEHTSVWTVDWNGKARIVGNEHPCLHPDALVLTEAGYRPIQTVQTGDRVYAADGRFHDVAHVSSHPYTSSELVRITARGGNVATLASDNHPFLVWRPERQRRRLVGGTVVWARADEVRVGDYTMTPVLAEPELDPMPERDAEYWFLFGLYLAQGVLQRAGHGGNRYPSFSLHKKRQDLVQRVRDRWDSVGEYDASEYRRPSQGVTVMAFDAEAGAEFERLGGRGARAKRLDPLVLRLPAEKRRAVLEGWLNGDGCRVHNRDYWQGKTVSPDLAAHLALLGESVGRTVSVFRYDPPAVLPSIQGRQLKSASPEYHLYFYERGDPQARHARVTHVEHDGQTYQVRYVKRVERVPYTGDVWNLSVEGCPTFQTAVGMSHNTQKPVELFARPMRKHTKPGAICFEPFSGSGSQLIAAQETGRRCFAIELEPVFVDVAVRRWQRATGKEATLEGTGQTWAEVAAERGIDLAAVDADLGETAPAEAEADEEAA